VVIDINGSTLEDGKNGKLEEVSGRLGLSLLKTKKREAMEVLGEIAVLVGYSKGLLNELEKLVEDVTKQ
jgi:hypothetical protein